MDKTKDFDPLESCSKSVALMNEMRFKCASRKIHGLPLSKASHYYCGVELRELGYADLLRLCRWLLVKEIKRRNEVIFGGEEGSVINEMEAE